MQSNLFSTGIDVALDQPIARRSDPVTSQEAARSITDSGVRGEQHRIVLDLVKHHPRSTSLELARHGDIDRYIVARRLPELEKAGLVRKAEIRICRIGSRNALTWEIA